MSQRSILYGCLAAYCLVLAAPAQHQPHADELALKPEIDAAISKGIEHLMDEQVRDGSWGLHGDFVGGRTGLCLYTLLQCGVSRDHPAIRRAVRNLDAVDPGTTYATACMILAYDALRMGREDRIREFVNKLVEWQKHQGDWGYPHGEADLSNTQYAALGLWVATKRGIKIDTDVFVSLAERLEDYRKKPQMMANSDLKSARTGVAKVEVAGFGYRPNPQAEVTGSMTGAGIAVLSICKAGLGKRLQRGLRRRVDKLQGGAMRWLAMNFTPAKNPNGGHHLYYLYGIERVGALMQTELLGDHRWYLEGARHLIGAQRNKGWGNATDTCFALLFLRRATSSRAAVTGAKRSVAHIFQAGDANADVRLRGAGISRQRRAAPKGN